MCDSGSRWMYGGDGEADIDSGAPCAVHAVGGGK